MEEDAFSRNREEELENKDKTAGGNGAEKWEEDVGIE